MDGDVYPDRPSAGRRLVRPVRRLRLRDPVVLALPRGGVPVGRPLADALGAPLDVVVVRKVGAPFQPELGLGAVGEDDVLVLDERLIAQLGLHDAEVDDAVARANAELERRVVAMPDARRPVDVARRDVVIVDDGIATGGTAAAAVQVLRARGAARVIVAVPVASESGAARLEEVADTVVCPRVVRGPFAVGAWYDDFHQLDDAEVTSLLLGG